MMKQIFFILVSLVVLNASMIYADRGSIPFEPYVEIFEPNQRAMIAWNGKEEILLLSTDLYASTTTKVLEVIPLPSEPVVKKGDVEVFKKATELINSKLMEEMLSHGLMRGKSADVEEPPAGELTFHKKIGAHDISVTHVLKGKGFIKWVKDYLKSAGVDNPMIPEAMNTVINEYIEEDFKWFVFDVIELDDKPKTNEAIQYRFKTDFLYYPLKITRTEQGYTTIDLLILTPKLLSNFPGISIENVKLPHNPVTITSGELKTLSEEMDELLGHRKEIKLRIWQIEGKLSEFTQDLIAK
jgi:hypothetical protein